MRLRNRLIVVLLFTWVPVRVDGTAVGGKVGLEWGTHDLLESPRSATTAPGKD